MGKLYRRLDLLQCNGQSSGYNYVRSVLCLLLHVYHNRWKVRGTLNFLRVYTEIINFDPIKQAYNVYSCSNSLVLTRSEKRLLQQVKRRLREKLRVRARRRGETEESPRRVSLTMYSIPS